MSPLLIYPLPGNDAFAHNLARALSAEVGVLETRTFPDGESYVRLQTSPDGRDVVMVCTLSDPDAKFLRLAFAATAAKDLGAHSVGLVAPYLAYMRQDTRFRDGEAVSSVPFARLLSSIVDWLVTVDPHLHRRASLSEIYSIPTDVIHAGPVIAEWIKTNVPDPVIVGPDSESQQWVAAVAMSVGAPYRVLTKVRSGDRSVSISLPDLAGVEGCQPVLVDDILSSGRTLAVAAQLFEQKANRLPFCVVIHALSVPGNTTSLQAKRLVSTDTIPGPFSEIAVAPLVADAVAKIRRSAPAS